jgi:hypothetical protein
LYFFDADGTLAWKREQRGTSGSPEELFSPEDIERVDDNSFVILDNIGNTLQFFDTADNLLRVIDLEEVWGHKPNYPTDVDVDSSNGFVIYDFDAPSPLIRTDSNGSIVSEIVPQLDSGRQLRVVGGVKVSSQGDLWTCDGTALYRLSNDGVVEHVIGLKPLPDELDKPAFVAVGPDDRIYIADGRTDATHVFSANGNRLGICVPNPQDLSETTAVEDIAVTPNGEIYVSYGLDVEDIGNSSQFVHFGTDFSRKGEAIVKADSIAQGLRFQPAGDRSWFAGYDDLFLLKGLNGTIRTISRTSRNAWLESLGNIAVAPDGSLALVSGHEDNGFFISTFAPDGASLSSFEISAAWKYAHIAYDGARVYALIENEVFFAKIGGEPVGRFELPPGLNKDSVRGPFLADQSRQLWFVDLNDLELLKFAIPILTNPGATD